MIKNITTANYKSYPPSGLDFSALNFNKAEEVHNFFLTNQPSLNEVMEMSTRVSHLKKIRTIFFTEVLSYINDQYFTSEKLLNIFDADKHNNWVKFLSRNPQYFSSTLSFRHVWLSFFESHIKTIISNENKNINDIECFVDRVLWGVNMSDCVNNFKCVHEHPVFSPYAKTIIKNDEQYLLQLIRNQSKNILQYIHDKNYCFFNQKKMDVCLIYCAHAADINMLNVLKNYCNSLSLSLSVLSNIAKWSSAKNWDIDRSPSLEWMKNHASSLIFPKAINKALKNYISNLLRNSQTQEASVLAPNVFYILWCDNSIVENRLNILKKCLLTNKNYASVLHSSVKHIINEFLVKCKDSELSLMFMKNGLPHDWVLPIISLPIVQKYLLSNAIQEQISNSSDATIKKM